MLRVGYWQYSKYWPEGYWQDDYWPGTAVTTGNKAVQVVVEHRRTKPVTYKHYSLSNFKFSIGTHSFVVKAIKVKRKEHLFLDEDLWLSEL